MSAYGFRDQEELMQSIYQAIGGRSYCLGCSYLHSTMNGLTRYDVSWYCRHPNLHFPGRRIVPYDPHELTEGDAPPDWCPINIEARRSPNMPGGRCPTRYPEPKPHYDKPDSETITFTYGQLRQWAGRCNEVRDWMNKNLPMDIFKTSVELKSNHVYEFDGASGLILVLVVRVEESPDKFILSSITFGNPVSKKPLTISELNREYGCYIKKDLGGLDTEEGRRALLVTP